MDDRLLKLEVKQGVKSFDVDVTAGRKTVEIELFNQGVTTGPFSTNPNSCCREN